jgi:YHS domain-containing protein
MKNKKLLITGFLMLVAAVFAACSRTTAVDDISKTSDGKALSGYDPVAYFAVKDAVQGDPRFEFAWNGAKWLFSSQENLDRFRANPEAYAPQFGGYCAFAISEGHTATGDPQAWKVVDGKLYLNYNKEVKQKWEQNQAERIQKAEVNWGEFKTDGTVKGSK